LLADPTLILNESELQAALQLKLLNLLPHVVPASLAPGTLARAHHPQLTLPRVFRELKLDAGRAAIEADLVVLTKGPQVVLPKENGGPKAFQAPLDAVIETKIDTSRETFMLGGAGGSVLPSVINDLARWRVAIEDGRLRHAFAVILTPRPERYINVAGVLTIRQSYERLVDWRPGMGSDARSTGDIAKRGAESAIGEVHHQYRLQPIGMLREKDFESRIMGILRAACGWSSVHRLSNGRHVAINPVRAQWSGGWASILGMRRRHDLAILRPDGVGLHVEIELKTSHSDSHNWFRKLDVEKEMSSMSRLISASALDYGCFVMFRYGNAKWSADAEILSARHPGVAFKYLCS